MKLKLYLDTSVLSAYFDERTPDRQIQTREFWLGQEQFDLFTSELTRQEIEQTYNRQRRLDLNLLLASIQIFPLNTEMLDLARQYVASGIFSSLMLNDAIHVAAAVYSECDVLISWNFRHLVNRHRRAQVQQVNIGLGLPSIEIIAPPEL